MKRRTLAISLTTTLVLITVVAFAIKRSASKVVATGQENHLVSIREKARQKGHYIGTIRPTATTRYDDVESLATRSTLVVTGLIQQQRSFIPENNDRMIVTGHQLVVEQVLKGNVRTGDFISIETLGGKVQFEDGSTAELKAPEILKDPQLGKAYLFFLRPQKSNYRLVGGPQGLFQITTLGKIKAQVPASDTLARKYDNQTLDQLAAVIRQAITQP